MNNLGQMLYLKMGNKLIFKEPLKGIKYAVEQYNNSNSNMNSNMNSNHNYDIYKPNYNQQSNIPKPNNNNNMNTNRKLNFQNMDVLPKFIDYENSQDMNRELAHKLEEKTTKLKTLINAYISKEQSDYTKAIMDVELEMDKYKSIMEQQKNKDFDGFKDLLSFINDNKTNSNLKEIKFMSLTEYRGMNYDIKKKILSGIFENRESLAKRLNVNITTDTHKRIKSQALNNINFNMNFQNNRDKNNNNYNINEMNNYNMNNMNNDNYNNYNRMMSNQHFISDEQFQLFKIFINNPKMPNEHAITYFDKTNPKVKDAAEKYFKNIYRADYITLNYVYKNRATKVHKFRFSGDVNALFLAAQEDYLSVSNPRLFAQNEKEIIKDKKIKCIGALNLENNSNINVW